MKNYKAVPANIVDTTDFINRLMNGEEFYGSVICKGAVAIARLYYDSTEAYPFRSSILNGVDVNLPEQVWAQIKELEIRTEITWRDGVTPTYPVLCWVSDDYIAEKSMAVWIQRVETPKGRKTIYIADDNIPYHNATPVDASFCNDQWIVVDS